MAPDSQPANPPREVARCRYSSRIDPISIPLIPPPFPSLAESADTSRLSGDADASTDELEAAVLTLPRLLEPDSPAALGLF
jgi:hypothetical protein